MAQERCEEEMETSGIVIHKGEKDEKYQLYVEDYVMSYLKKHGSTQRNRKLFFFGKKELREKKYYIYGAGLQRQISHFSQYEKLHEITCRYVMDMPVFSIQEKNKTHELTGYYIFYQSNEAMQNYMIALRAEQEQEAAQPQTEFRQTGRGEIADKQTERAANTEQKIFDIKKQRMQEKEQEKNNAPKQDKHFKEDGFSKQDNSSKQYSLSSSGRTSKVKGGFIVIQLIAIFIILAAIVINTTNSYSKLEELNQAAIEVFFAMENEDAMSEEVVQMEGTTLYLTELDKQMAKENEEAVESGEAAENKETVESEEATESGETVVADETDGNRMDAETTVTGDGEAAEQEMLVEEADAQEEIVEEVAAIEEISPSEEAFARDFAQYYRIEKGDTLYTISQKMYGNTDKVKEICELNQIADPDNIKYGQKILLP